MKIAWSTPWGTVRTSTAFHLLPFAEQNSIIAHEYGHIAYLDGLKRLFMVFSGWAYFHPQQYFAKCEAQEFAADDFAAATGHAPGLIRFLERCPNVKIDGYPLPSERIKRLIHGR